jgi:hypothetical protein
MAIGLYGMQKETGSDFIFSFSEDTWNTHRVSYATEIGPHGTFCHPKGLQKAAESGYSKRNWLIGEVFFLNYYYYYYYCLELLRDAHHSFIHLEPCCMCRETLLCGHGMACFVCKQRREMFAFFGILSLNLPIPLFVE